MRFLKITLWMVLFVWVSVSAMAAEVAKIGVIDFQKILVESDAGKKAQEEINAKGKSMEAELKKRGDEIEAMQQKLERERLVMSPEQLEQKQRDVRKDILDFKDTQRNMAEDFKKIEARFITQIRQEIFGVVEEIGARENYLLILEMREGGVVYFPKAIDITDDIIKAYNKKFASGKSS